MSALHLRCALVHFSAQRLIPDPPQQKSRAHDAPKFLERECERIAAAVAVDTCKHGGGCELATVNRQCEAHKVRMVLPAPAPFDPCRDQVVDRVEPLRCAWA